MTTDTNTEQTAATSTADTTATPSLEEIQKQLAAIQAERDALAAKAQELETKNKTLNSSIIEDKKKKAAEEKANLEKTGDVDALRAHYEKELNAERDARLKFESALVQNDRDLKVTKALTEAGGNTKLLSLLVNSRLKTEYEGGQVKYTVLDESGQPMFVKGKEATISDLVESLKASDDYAMAFQGSGVKGAGTGSSVSAVGAGASNPWAKGQENMTEQHKLLLTNPGKAAALKAAAGVA